MVGRKPTAASVAGQRWEGQRNSLAHGERGVPAAGLDGDAAAGVALASAKLTAAAAWLCGGSSGDERWPEEWRWRRWMGARCGSGGELGSGLRGSRERGRGAGTWAPLAVAQGGRGAAGGSARLQAGRPSMASDGGTRGRRRRQPAARTATADGAKSGGGGRRRRCARGGRRRTRERGKEGGGGSFSPRLAGASGDNGERRRRATGGRRRRANDLRDLLGNKMGRIRGRGVVYGERIRRSKAAAMVVLTGARGEAGRPKTTVRARRTAAHTGGRERGRRGVSHRGWPAREETTANDGRTTAMGGRSPRPPREQNGRD